MIKYINIIFIVTALFLTGFIFYNTFFRYTENIPVFTYTEIDNSQPFSDHDIQKNKETVIIYVSTRCGSCENIIQSVSKNFDHNRNCIIITSEKNIQESKSFFKKFSLDQEIIVLNDHDNRFTKDFQLGVSVTYPTVFFFDKNSRLIKVSHHL